MDSPELAVHRRDLEETCQTSGLNPSQILEGLNLVISTMIKDGGPLIIKSSDFQVFVSSREVLYQLHPELRPRRNVH